MTSILPGVREPSLKRPFDFFLALVGLSLSAPVWVVLSVAIYAEDRQAVFFTQERCGRYGRRYRHIKFRTMKLPPQGQDQHRVTSPEHDPRVTRVGRVLRITALDELPELINILCGDMSFVGPRPLPFRIEVVSQYSNIAEVPGYQMRSQVRPGLTGLAQICAPKDVDHRSKFRYDNLYVGRMSLCLDLRLLMLSLWVTLRGRWEWRGKRKV